MGNPHYKAAITPSYGLYMQALGGADSVRGKKVYQCLVMLGVWNDLQTGLLKIDRKFWFNVHQVTTGKAIVDHLQNDCHQQHCLNAPSSKRYTQNNLTQTSLSGTPEPQNNLKFSNYGFGWTSLSHIQSLNNIINIILQLYIYIYIVNITSLPCHTIRC